MTNEETIELLKMELGCRSKDMEKCFEVYGLECKGCGYYVDYNVLTEAIKTAIEALEAQPKSCEYAVNALAVEEMLKDLLPERGMWEIDGDEAKTAICEVVRSALGGLWKLPFVKPDSKESSSTHKALDNNLPSAQQEIIACADCKFWICHDRRCGYWNHGVKQLEWCCHAERKTDGRFD